MLGRIASLVRFKLAFRNRAKRFFFPWTRPRVTLQLRQGWLRAIGAPDYRAYLAHHAARHPGTAPMSERDYVNMFIERRYNRRGVGRCG